MTLALLLALPAILLLAVTTYRQSQALFGRQLGRRWRIAGWALLLAAAMLLLAGDDRGRGLIFWICGCAPIAALAATVLGLRGPRRAFFRKNAPPVRPAEQVREGAAAREMAAATAAE